MVARIGGNNPPQPGPLRPETARLPPPNPDIELPPNLGRPPTANDLIIKRTFDGLTPEAAASKIKNALQGSVAPQNQQLVDTTVTARVRDMQVALNNVFTPGTPNRKFLESKLPADIQLLGSMSGSNPVVYQITPTQPRGAPQYYTKDWSGNFVQMPKPPIQVVMQAKVVLNPMGLKMDYPAWQNKGLAGQITTITEG